MDLSLKSQQLLKLFVIMVERDVVGLEDDRVRLAAFLELPYFLDRPRRMGTCG
jgi:hypothetical protein